MLLLDFFFFNDTATTEIYTLSLHDALPICPTQRRLGRHHAKGLLSGHLRPGADRSGAAGPGLGACPRRGAGACFSRSEEHTSELQSRQYLVCRLLLEKKKKKRQSDFTVCLK